jgi:predicted glycoside hydrolase/deacetylase ChbG (UPF0249 family)
MKEGNETGKRLIINADDFGYPMGTVEAITTLFEAGIVTSTTALVNQPHWPEAAAYLRDHPGLAAGVHLVMNRGQPILPPEQVPSLVDARGFFPEDLPLVLRIWRLRLPQLKAEWRAQIEKFIADTGRQPDHLDLHTRYPYFIPSWFRVTLELAQEYAHIPVRMPFDDALDHKAADVVGGSRILAFYVRWQGRRYQRMVEQHGLKRANYLEMSFSLFVTDESHRSAEYLLELLDALPEGTTELLAHPGTEDYRERDTRALLDPRVKRRIQELGIELVTFGDL